MTLTWRVSATEQSMWHPNLAIFVKSGFISAGLNNKSCPFTAKDFERWERKQVCWEKKTSLWTKDYWQKQTDLPKQSFFLFLYIFTDGKKSHKRWGQKRETNKKADKKKTHKSCNRKNRKTEIQSAVESEAKGSGVSEIWSSTTDLPLQAGPSSCTEPTGVTWGDFSNIFSISCTWKRNWSTSMSDCEKIHYPSMWTREQVCLLCCFFQCNSSSPAALQ